MRNDEILIGGKVYRFVSVDGRQLVSIEGQPYQEIGCLRDNAKGTISISNSLPISEQLAQAARESLIAAQETAKYLDDLGMANSLDRSPIPGVPLLLKKANAR